ncbi:transmembrane GTPase fzo1 [Rhodotorula toruloides]|uniref:Transmembrane GTPase fzo1 n=1 Tax=Rhodotorula toruloides TaxID=5286 RepID=A0A511KIJ8_RHOTO|nr:transmembrane GTPase fzo1 [Rhodotorula toruloides]
MQSAGVPLRLASEEPQEFPFVASPAQSPRPMSRRSSLLNSSPASAQMLFGKAWHGTEEELQRKHEDEQRAYGDKRELLVQSLDEASVLVKSLATFNQNKWTVHYPHQLGVSTVADAPIPPHGAASSHSTPGAKSAVKGARQAPLRRSASMFPEEAAGAEKQDSPARPSPQRAYSLVDSPPAPAAPKDSTPAHPLSILSLDLKMGHPSTSTAQLPALIPSLSLSTLSQLLSRRLTSSLSHISSLRTRVLDLSSRVLVTGDLNAGKSTLVNALLRREVMPWDQQPCTTVFCEVLDASLNEGEEELHAIRDVEKYDRSNAATFDVFSLEQVYDVQDTGDEYQIVKAYVHDGRAPTSEDEPNPSFIKNGLVDISLIDAPGLNRDTLSTTALFARQSEIDVIVFVVSAENHFTLSAKEFLWNASREKAYVFIVVNKWNGIRDKARCMRVVGEQIKQLSPATWENRAELVHFVDAAEYVEGPVEVSVEEPSAFDHLEQSLRSFVLLKRSKSKLAPAKHYLLNLLADLSTLASANVVAANDELTAALRELERIRPIHERLSAQRDEVEEGVDRVEETVVESVKAATWSRLERALNYVAEGKVVPPAESTIDADSRQVFEGTDSFDGPTELPPYPGVWGIWEWANDVKKTLVRALEAEVRAAEDDARFETVDGVKTVMNDLGDKYLPEDGETAGEAVQQEQQKNGRVFRPEVMFAKRRRGVGRLAARGVSTGLGLGSAGLGVNWSVTDFDVSLFDMFDFERMTLHGNALRGRKEHKLVEDDVVEKGTLVGLGLGSIGMVGSRIIGIKGTMGSLTRMIEMLGSKQARKWAGPVIGVLTVGLVIYVIVDLPCAIPRNIGRKLQLSLSPPPAPLSGSSSPSSPPVTFASAHSDRIAREVRKVLRLAGWDLRERFRAALDKSAAERKEVEGVVARAEGALHFLEEFEGKVREGQSHVKVIDLD